MVRAFLAIDLPKELKKKLSELSKIEPPGRAKLKWVEEENFHITLHFFGNITEKLAEKILKKCKEAFEEVFPFTLEITEIGFFANKGIPRVIWMGVEDPSENLLKIHKALKGVLKKLKLEESKEGFHPHITLFRIKKLDELESFQRFFEDLKRASQGYRGLKIPVREIILFKSELSPNGPKYTPIGKIFLVKSL
ncbi:MAG: RNA 2',3'-cyclic phosphodiesterase [Caldimicrobium sp.]